MGNLWAERPFDKCRTSETYPALRPDRHTVPTPARSERHFWDARSGRGERASRALPRKAGPDHDQDAESSNGGGWEGGSNSRPPGRFSGRGFDAFCSPLALLPAIRYLRRAPMRSAPQSKERNHASLAQ